MSGRGLRGRKWAAGREKLIRISAYLELQGHRATALGLLDLAGWYAVGHMVLVCAWLRESGQ